MEIAPHEQNGLYEGWMWCTRVFRWEGECSQKSNDMEVEAAEVAILKKSLDSGKAKRLDIRISDQTD